MTLLGIQVLAAGLLYGLIMFLVGSEIANRAWRKKEGEKKNVIYLVLNSDSADPSDRLHGMGTRKQMKKDPICK